MVHRRKFYNLHTKQRITHTNYKSKKLNQIHKSIFQTTCFCVLLST